MAKRADKSKMPCNKPRRASGGSKKFVVKACQDGKEKIIRFGDPNMTIKKDQPGRRKSFRARHRCDTDPPSKMTARYWSCRKWSTVVIGILVEALLRGQDVSMEISHALM